MAVTPVGNPYVESSDLVANYPGVSEALAERIDIIGVNPFADSTARATAIPSPVQGQMASLNNDDQVYRYDGAAWVVVGDSGMTLVEAQSFNATTVSVNGCFSATYQNYLILLTTTEATRSGGNMTMRLRVSGTDASGANYTYVYLYTHEGAGPARVSATAATSWFFALNDASNAAGTSIAAHVYSPFEANRTRLKSQQVISFASSSFVAGIEEYAGHNGETSFDGFSIISPSNIQGVVRIYGYKNT